ncbi:MAG: radical SAM protein [Nitrospirae bacterium]|nr:radical SAM protein [Magnetococcales bacterium]HAT50692.1 B12-binding domain-containing radical SAM protein [Alphaproteobacteria bacterium]
MKILFFNPPFKGRFSRTSRSPAVTKGGTFYFPIWLAYAAGYAHQEGFDVRLVDGPAQGLSLPDVWERLGSWIPDLAVVDTSTPSIYSDVAAAAAIKARFPGSFVMVVGTHPSATPEETLGIAEGVDAVALGEYDQTIVDLARALDEKKPVREVAGLCLHHGDTTLLTPKRGLIENLDALPFVSEVYARHLDIRDYFFAAANYPLVQIITGRGCPYHCFFCVYPQVFHSRRFRTRSPENVVAEMAYITQNLPQVREIGIEDDCFTANYSHVRAICTLILERNIKIKWYCNVRGDVKPELLQLMKQAGCRLVTVGFESGSQKILDNMNKGVKLENYRRFVKDVQTAGIMVHGCMMVGNPGDTSATLAESYQFSVEANCDSMQFYPLYVYPGTEAYDWAKDKGYLRVASYDQWLTEDGLHNCVLDTPELSADQMVALCDYYLKKYHLRPKYILKKLLQGLRNPMEGYRTLMSAKVFFSKFFSGQLSRSNP